jgi:hypothetical protein
MVTRILDDPLWIGLGGPRDHQIGTPLKSGEEVSKRQKGCLRIFTLLCLGPWGIIRWELHTRTDINHIQVSACSAISRINPYISSRKRTGYKIFRQPVTTRKRLSSQKFTSVVDAFKAVKSFQIYQKYFPVISLIFCKCFNPVKVSLSARGSFWSHSPSVFNKFKTPLQIDDILFLPCDNSTNKLLNAWDIYCVGLWTRSWLNILFYVFVKLLNPLLHFRCAVHAWMNKLNAIQWPCHIVINFASLQ